MGPEQVGVGQLRRKWGLSQLQGEAEPPGDASACAYGLAWPKWHGQGWPSVFLSTSRVLMTLVPVTCWD